MRACAEGSAPQVRAGPGGQHQINWPAVSTRPPCCELAPHSQAGLTANARLDGSLCRGWQLDNNASAGKANGSVGCSARANQRCIRCYGLAPALPSECISRAGLRLLRDFGYRIRFNGLAQAPTSQIVAFCCCAPVPVPSRILVRAAQAVNQVLLTPRLGTVC